MRGRNRDQYDRFLAQPKIRSLASRIADGTADPLLSRHQVQAVGLDIRGPALLDRFFLLRQELDLERVDDRLGDFVLDGEDVVRSRS